MNDGHGAPDPTTNDDDDEEIHERRRRDPTTNDNGDNALERPRMTVTMPEVDREPVLSLIFTYMF